MTLEDYFYSFEDKLDYFPGRHNYVSAYKTFKDFMDREVHKETKAMTLMTIVLTIYEWLLRRYREYYGMKTNKYWI